VPRNDPAYAPDLHEYLTEPNDLCKSGLTARSLDPAPRAPRRQDAGPLCFMRFAGPAHEPRRPGCCRFVRTAPRPRPKQKTLNVVTYVATHKMYDMPRDSGYRPIHVGRAGAMTELGFPGDDVGENLSHKNATYCELTALYWMWKNTHDEAYGLAHYRRYFRGSGWRGVATRQEMAAWLSKADVILARPRHYYIETVRSHYANAHHETDLDIARDAVALVDSSYLGAFDRVMSRRGLSLYNMFLMRRELLEDYCSWLFQVLEECERHIPVQTYDAHQARVYGFLGELLLNVWVEHQRGRIKVAHRSVRNLEGEATVTKAVGVVRRKFARD